MKNKKLTMLLVLVACIWGTIGYKVISQLNEDDLSPIEPRRFVAKGVSESKVEYTLSLSYVDPFLKKVTSSSEPVKRRIVKQPVKVEPTVPPIIIDWSVVQYFGLVNNNTRKSKTASVKINANEYFVREGEMVDGFSVGIINVDSIKMMFGTSSKFIKRNK